MVINRTHPQDPHHLRTETLEPCSSPQNLAQVRKVKLLATGKYLPKNKVTAEQLGQKLGIEAD
ncbi:hypothetical protein NO758_03591 [Planktothrix agardhii]|nr:hypothetical protein NO758_03591 [Planktothrix agardhii]